MNKYLRLKDELETNKRGQMKEFGNSMLPIIKSGTLLTYEKSESYKVGDVVFCKVKGRFMTHKIAQISADGKYLITNNRGHENGWASKNQIYGKVIFE